MVVEVDVEKIGVAEVDVEIVDVVEVDVEIVDVKVDLIFFKFIKKFKKKKTF